MENFKNCEKREKREKRQKREKCEKRENHTKSPLLVYIEAGFAGFIIKNNN